MTVPWSFTFQQEMVRPQGSAPHQHHHDHSLSDHLGHKHTPDAAPAGPLLLHSLRALAAAGRTQREEEGTEETEAQGPQICCLTGRKAGEAGGAALGLEMSLGLSEQWPGKSPKRLGMT